MEGVSGAGRVHGGDRESRQPQVTTATPGPQTPFSEGYDNRRGLFFQNVESFFLVFLSGKIACEPFRSNQVINQRQEFKRSPVNRPGIEDGDGPALTGRLGQWCGNQWFVPI